MYEHELRARLATRRHEPRRRVVPACLRLEEAVFVARADGIASDEDEDLLEQLQLYMGETP